MHTLITGGTGLIGRALIASLVADGHSVTVLSRAPQKHQSTLPAGVTAVGWDGKTADGWGHLADGADAIVNLAGEGIADGRWSADRKQRIVQSRVAAGKAVVEAIRQAETKPKVLVQASAVGYYGVGDVTPLPESSAPGNDFLSQVCFDWEASSAEVERMGVRRVVIRTGIVGRTPREAGSPNSSRTRLCTPRAKVSVSSGRLLTSKKASSMESCSTRGVTSWRIAITWRETCA